MEPPQSLEQAKQLLLDLELRKGNDEAMIGDYQQILSVVVNAISKLTADDDKSDTSLTVPETIGSDTRSFLFCGGSVASEDTYPSNKSYGGWIEEQHDTEPLNWKRSLAREDQRDAAEEDILSISSDVVPLYMTDYDALDEIEFTRELMGYVEGFEATEMPISRIEEDDDDEELYFEPYAPTKPIRLPSKINTSRKQERPPIPRQPQPRKHLQQLPHLQQRQGQSHERCSQVGSRTSSAPSRSPFGHRRQRSGSSAPTKASSAPTKASSAQTKASSAQTRASSAQTKASTALHQNRREDPPGRVQSISCVSLQGGEYRRAVGACARCKKKNKKGNICQCGKWEC